MNNLNKATKPIPLDHIFVHRLNLEEAKRICRSLSLDVQFRPGG